VKVSTITEIFPVYEDAKKRYPDKEVMLAKVPTADTLIL